MTQQDFLKKCKAKSSQIHDFLATGNAPDIYETPKYFYKHFRVAGNKELRIWKKSGRVTASKTATK